MAVNVLKFSSQIVNLRILKEIVAEATFSVCVNALH